jgi:hypothetical protein
VRSRQSRPPRRDAGSAGSHGDGTISGRGHNVLISLDIVCRAFSGLYRSFVTPRQAMQAAVLAEGSHLLQTGIECAASLAPFGQ